MSWVEVTFKWALPITPGAAIKSVLVKLTYKAGINWFKHLKNQSLKNAKIYDVVKNQLAISFNSPFIIMLQVTKTDTPKKRIQMAFVNYGVKNANNKVWG